MVCMIFKCIYIGVNGLYDFGLMGCVVKVNIL